MQGPKNAIMVVFTSSRNLAHLMITARMAAENYGAHFPFEYGVLLAIICGGRGSKESNSSFGISKLAVSHKLAP